MGKREGNTTFGQKKLEKTRKEGKGKGTKEEGMIRKAPLICLREKGREGKRKTNFLPNLSAFREI